MTTRLPLVLADDGLIEQLQVGDATPESRGTAQLLIQNNAIIRLLAGIALKMDAVVELSAADTEQLVAETQP